MKSFFIIIHVFFLVSCAKSTELDSQVSDPLHALPMSVFQQQVLSAQESELFDKTWAPLERDIEEGSLPSVSFLERCRANPKLPTTTRNLCLFAFILKKENSPYMDEELSRHFLEEENLLAAAVIRQNLLETLSEGQFSAALPLVQKLPSLFQLRFFKIWIQKNNITLPTKLQVLKWIQAMNLDSPAEIAEARSVFQKMDYPFQEIIEKYCSPRQDKDLKLRCWRFLAILKRENGEELGTLHTVLPQYSAQEWALFQRSYPELANLTIY